MSLNDLLFGLGMDLAKYPGDSVDDALNRRVLLRKALTEWGDQRFKDGYDAGRRDLLDARIEAKNRAEIAASAGTAAGKDLDTDGPHPS